MEVLYLARQPIYDRDLRVLGYELLYRGGEVPTAEFADEKLASVQTIINTFMHMGVDSIVGSAQAFINIPQGLIVDREFELVPAGQTVLEIESDVYPSAEVVNGIRRLKSEGFRVALHDFEYTGEHEVLLGLADYIKIDILRADEQQLRTRMEEVRHYPALLIAERVESEEQYSLCCALGFDAYQGFFFCRPRLIRQKNIPANRAVLLTLLQQLQDPDLDLKKLEVTLAQDVPITYKFLRYINSAGFSMRREVQSIKDAVALIGVDAVRKWSTLILMTTLSTDKPKELIKTAMVRGRFCELLAQVMYPSIKSQMFITGLFSVLDALMDKPMVDLLDDLSLSAPIKAALLDRSGDHGTILKDVIAYEKGNWSGLSRPEQSRVYTDTYMAAIRWADQNSHALHD